MRGLVHRVAVADLHIETEGLHFLHKHVERLGHTSLEGVVALDDGLVDAGAALHVVGLHGQELLQGVGRAVGFHRPHFHFAEALAAILRLAAQRLLGDERVGTDSAGVNLVRNQVAELHHVDVANDNLLVEGLAGVTVEQVGLAVLADEHLADFLLVQIASFLEVAADFLFLDAVEDGRGELEAEELRGPAQVGLEELPDVHARGHAQRVQDDVHRCAVCEEREVFLGHDLGDDALVTVATGHLVADRKLALGGDVNLHLLDHARINVLAGFGAADFLVVLHLQLVELLLKLADDLVDLVADRRRVDLDLVIDLRQLAQQRLGDLAVRRDDDLAGLGVGHVERDFFTEQDVRECLGELVTEGLDLALIFLVHDLLRALGVLVLGLDRGAHVGRLLRRDLHVHDHAVGAGGNLERGVLHVGGLLAEDRPEQALFRREFRLGLRSDLADEDIAGLDLCADADDAVGSEVSHRLFAEVGDVAGDFLRPELGVAGAHLELINVDGGEHVVLQDAFADQDGVLEVVAVPRHERDEHVAAEGEFAAVCARAVSNDLALLDRVALGDERLLVHAGRCVGAHELAEAINPHAVFRRVLELLLRVGNFPVLRDDDLVARDGGNFARLFGDQHGDGVTRHALFQTGGDERRLGDQQRHCLALHVRTHQRAVRVVMLKEGDQPGSHGHELLGRHIHVIHFAGLHVHEVALAAAGHAVGGEMALVIERRVGLRDGETFLAVAREVVQFAGHTALHDFAVRRLNEAEVVHARKSRERGDEADVWAFGCFNRANAAVVRRMHVADFEARAVARKSPGSERRQAAFVSQLGERVDLVHELRELRATEEVAHDGGERLGVDELRGRHRVHFLIEERHALLDEALGAGQTHAALVGEQFAHGADAAAAEMVNVVHAPLALLELEEIFGGVNQVRLGENARGRGFTEVELLVDLVAAHASEVVALRVEEQALDERTGVGGSGRIAGTEAAVNVLERLFLVLGRIFLKALDDDAVVHRDVHDLDLGHTQFGNLLHNCLGKRLECTGDDDVLVGVNGVLDENLVGDVFEAFSLLHRELLDVVEHLDDFLVGAADHVLLGLLVAVEECERTEERGRQEFPAALLAVEIDVKHVARVEHCLIPRAAVWDDAEAVELLAVRVDGLLEGQTGGAVELADDDALGPVDDKGALRGHERQFAHEHLLLFRPACLVAKAEGDVERRAEGQALADAVEPGKLGVANLEAGVFENGLAIVALDGKDLVEHGLQPEVLALGRRHLRLQELHVGVDLDFDHVRRHKGFLDLAEVDAFCVARWHFVYSSWSGIGRTFSLRDEKRQASGSPPEVRQNIKTISATNRAAAPFIPPSGGRADGGTGAAARLNDNAYLSSTFAPASSSFFLAASASTLLTPSSTGFGALSTSALASARPRPALTSRTALMVPILLAPASLRITSKVSLTSAGAAAAAPPPAAATATGAAAVTPHLPSNCFTRSAASKTVSALNSSTNFAISAMLPFFSLVAPGAPEI